MSGVLGEYFTRPDFCNALDDSFSGGILNTSKSTLFFLGIVLFPSLAFAADGAHSVSNAPSVKHYQDGVNFAPPNPTTEEGKDARVSYLLDEIRVVRGLENLSPEKREKALSQADKLLKQVHVTEEAQNEWEKQNPRPNYPAAKSCPEFSESYPIRPVYPEQPDDVKPDSKEYKDWQAKLDAYNQAYKIYSKKEKVYLKKRKPFDEACQKIQSENQKANNDFYKQEVEYDQKREKASINVMNSDSNHLSALIETKYKRLLAEREWIREIAKLRNLSEAEVWKGVDAIFNQGLQNPLKRQALVEGDGYTDSAAANLILGKGVTQRAIARSSTDLHDLDAEFAAKTNEANQIQADIESVRNQLARTKFFGKKKLRQRLTDGEAKQVEITKAIEEIGKHRASKKAFLDEVTRGQAK